MHHIRRPDHEPSVRVVISGHIDARGRHDDTQVCLPAAHTGQGDVWITPVQVTLDDADPSHQGTGPAQARQEATPQERHATELRAELIDVKDAIIRTMEALAAGHPDPLHELRTWASAGTPCADIRTTAVEGQEAATGRRPARTDRDDAGYGEHTCRVTDNRHKRSLAALCAQTGLSADELVSAIVTDVLYMADQIPGLVPRITAASDQQRPPTPGRARNLHIVDRKSTP